MASRRIMLLSAASICFATAPPVGAAQGSPFPAPVSRAAEGFAVSPPLRVLASADARAAGTAPQGRDVEIPLGTLGRGKGRRTSEKAGPEAGYVSPPPLGLMPSPNVSFDGLSSDDNLNVHGNRRIPPDTNGDVGPNHYVQMTNHLVRVFSKTGTPLTAPFKLSSLFASVGGQCANLDSGDPVVLYDPLADRWLLSQFCRAWDPTTHQMIAISQTPDPTGPYFVYDFRMPNTFMNDYPKFGVWTDAYYMTDNQFGNPGGFRGGGVFAFERARMLAGDPIASFIYFNLASNEGGMLPADIDGTEPPPPGTPGYFAQFQSALFGEGNDGLRLFEFRADFANPAASTFTARAESPLAVLPFDPRSPEEEEDVTGRQEIEQPAPGLAVDSISDRLMCRLAYRNFGTHESLVVTHTVNVGPGFATMAEHQAAIRYYELQRSGGAFSVFEQATFSPDTENRWMGSAAQDGRGNLAVGYSVSSAVTMPAIRYAGRLASDPPGGLFQGEASIVEGTGVQTDPTSRWGDYSALSVDPADDCMFWYTTEYYTAASQASSPRGWRTRVASFAFPSCTTPPRGTLSGTVTDSVTGQPVQGATLSVGGSESATTDAAGRYTVRRAPGAYGVSASRPSYQPSAARAAVTDGEVTTQDFSLVPRVPEQVLAVAGDGQTGIAGVPLPIPPRVVVRDVSGEPVGGVSVTFAVTEGGGSIIGTATQATNSRGEATVGWRLGDSAGPNRMSAVLEGGSAATLSATAVVLRAAIDDVSLPEGDSGLRPAVFTVNLSAPVPAGQSASVRYQTADGTASPNAISFTNPSAITIPQTGAATPYPSVINVPALPAPSKVTVTLTGVSHKWALDLDILLVGPQGQSVVLMSDVGRGAPVPNQTLTFDDDAPSIPAAPQTIAGGTYRPTNVDFPPGGDRWDAPAPPGPYGDALSAFVGVLPAGEWKLFVLDDYGFGAARERSGGRSGREETEAINGGWTLTFYVGDYASASGTLTFGPGVSTRTVSVPVAGDTAAEPDETFFVDLSGAVNVTLADARGQGRILNDDSSPVPSASITNVSVVEGTRGTDGGASRVARDVLPVWCHGTRAVFHIALDRPSGRPVGVRYETEDGTAAAGSDYAASSGFAVFPPGSTSRRVMVCVTPDAAKEADETFLLTLSQPVNAVIGTGIAQGTIIDDDGAGISGLR